MTDRVCHSLLEWFLHRSEQTPDRTALWLPTDDRYRRVSWGEWRADVLRAASALAKWGVCPGDRVAQLSENRYEWLVSDLALQCVQAVHVPLHAPLSAPQIAHEIRHCGARFVLVSTFEQLKKLAILSDIDRPVKSRQAVPAGIWVYDLCMPAAQSFVPQFALSYGPEMVSDSQIAIGERLAQTAVATARRDHVLKILYTSGTTGQSKGVVLTQGNLLFNAQSLAFAYGDRPFERKLNFLALSHVFAQTNDFYSTLVAGCELALARSRETILEDCQLVQPTFINGVPAFYQRVYRTLCEARRENEPGALRQILGGRIELCNSGGAPLSDHLHDYFQSQGIPLLQGYGLTETSPVISVSTPEADRRGCVGRPLAGVEVRIAHDGEIVTRGPQVSPGYYRDDEATAEANREGWFHTGDLGQLDTDGFLRITGRKKEMIVLTNGKKVAPLALEAALLADPLFHQAIVLGDGQNYLVALIRPDSRELERAIADRSRPTANTDSPFAKGDDDLTPAQETYALIAERIHAALQDRAPWEQIRKFAIIPVPLSVERDELTPKLSLRREVVHRHYADLIDALYREHLS